MLFTFSTEECFTIIDAHAHIFPARIAKKAADSIGGFYSIPTAHDGSSEELLASGKEAGISRFLVCSSATAPEQAVAINTFLAEECAAHGEFIGFGALHPGLSLHEVEEQLAFMERSGFHGVKLHPDFQRFNIDDRRMYPLYERIEGRFPILMHMGDDRYDYSSPLRLERMLRDFPRLCVIAAHLGGYRRWEEAKSCHFGENVRFDASSSVRFLPPEDARELILHYGTERVFWGSDYPMWDPGEDVRRFLSLGFSEREYAGMLAGNLKEFLNL